MPTYHEKRVMLDAWWLRVKNRPTDSDPTLVYDTFTDTNGTLLTAHTPAPKTVAANWTRRANNTADADIQSNQAREITVNGSRLIYVQDVARANVRVTTQAGNAALFYSIGVAMRHNGSEGNHWSVSFSDSGAGGSFNINEVTGGSGFNRATIAIPDPGAANAMHKVIGECNGNLISGTYDDAYPISYTSSVRNTSTQHGLDLSSALGSIAEYITIEAL